MRETPELSTVIPLDALKQNHFPFILLLQWLTIVSVIIFAAWVSWYFDFIQNIVRTDMTKLSVVIALLFILGSGHCAARCVFLATQANELFGIAKEISCLQRNKDRQQCIDTVKYNDSPVVDYISSMLRRQHQTDAPENIEQKLWRLNEILLERLKGAHEAGWFLTGILVKLGLLGTVIGFILMLSSVSNVVTLDPSQINLFFREMTHGMRVALNTTLVGLLGTMLLGIQYLLLDRGADKLLSDTTRFVETVRSWSDEIQA